MKHYKIIDNLLDRKTFTLIQNELIGSNIPWYFNDLITATNTGKVEEVFNFQFTHTFYSNYHFASDKIAVLKPIINYLDPSAIVRIKANLLTRTDTIIEHEFHKDAEHFSGKIAIFYVNTNNGFTILQDGTKINSIENRLLILSPDVYHTGTSCTDQKTRVVINFMYYNYEDSLL